ncbi:hypothetical protein BGW39_002003 [Mortierella sp. 14UC]|nr:hypothetical protein BGW39_002003 [Mortierella sp. 14UC]
MSASHRPSMEAFFGEKSRSATAFREGYLWPHINQEDLLKPKLFLIFLNARARNFPSAFSAADHEWFRFATTSGMLYSWDEYTDAASWLFSQRSVHPGYGLQILEVQERVYHFLLECCLQILHDMPPEPLMVDDIPIELEPPALSIAEGCSNSLAAVAAMTPYRLPASLNLTRLQDLVAAKRTAAEDHIWSLREDSSYFADFVLDMKEHRQELLSDIKGRQHSLMRPHPSKRFWDRIGKVMSFQQKHEGAIKYNDDLPNELLEAFLELEFSLSQYAKGPIQALKTIVVASPPLRASFVRLPEEGSSNIIQVMQKPGSTWDKTQSRLICLFQTLWDEQQRHLCGLYSILDEMERLVENDLKARNLFSSRVASLVVDLSLISECRHQISLYEPWVSSFETEAVSRQDELMAKYIQRTSRMQELDMALKQTLLADADPSDGKFFYPVEKRRTKEDMETMQKAERTLDTFWEKLDKYILQKIDVSRHGALIKFDSGDKAPQKIKVKTRGVALATPHPMSHCILQALRSLPIPSPLSRSAQPGEIPWNDFLHAMSAAGFAIEKLYGSAWHFMPSKLDVERSIQFHEPHPASKIPFKTARRFGRWLFRAYGWRRDMFKQEGA